MGFLEFQFLIFVKTQFISVSIVTRPFVNWSYQSLCCITGVCLKCAVFTRRLFHWIVFAMPSLMCSISFSFTVSPWPEACCFLSVLSQGISHSFSLDYVRYAKPDVLNFIVFHRATYSLPASQHCRTKPSWKPLFYPTFHLQSVELSWRYCHISFFPITLCV